MNVADVPGVNISGLIFDAGPVNSPVLLQLGVAGSTANNASNPVSVDDVCFRIGGAEAGSATTSFVDDSNNSIIDDVWAWRADHGTGVGWTANTATNGLIVNGNNVSAYGLAVEHYQGYEVEWNGQGGEVLFFQNENPYDVPSQSAWMSSSTQDGYPAFYVPNSVTSFTGYGMGSYSYFDQGVAIENAMAFQVPTSSGIQYERPADRVPQRLRRDRVGGRRHRHGGQLDQRRPQRCGHVQLIPTDALRLAARP